MNELVLSLKENNNTPLVVLLSNCPQVLNQFYDSAVKYYFSRLRYMITRLYDRVKLSIYSTRALFQMNFVAMKD